MQGKNGLIPREAITSSLPISCPSSPQGLDLNVPAPRLSSTMMLDNNRSVSMNERQGSLANQLLSSESFVSHGSGTNNGSSGGYTNSCEDQIFLGNEVNGSIIALCRSSTNATNDSRDLRGNMGTIVSQNKSLLQLSMSDSGDNNSSNGGNHGGISTNVTNISTMANQIQIPQASPSSSITAAVTRQTHRRTTSHPARSGSHMSGSHMSGSQGDMSILDLQEIFRSSADTVSLGNSPVRPNIMSVQQHSQRTITSMTSDMSSVDGRTTGYEYSENINILPSPDRSHNSSYNQEPISSTASDISNSSQPFLPSLANNSTVTDNNNGNNVAINDITNPIITKNPIMLGLEQLERQQAESEARKLTAQMASASFKDQQPPSLIHVSTDQDANAPQSTITSPTTAYGESNESHLQQENQNFLDNIAALDPNPNKFSVPTGFGRILSPFVMKRRTESFPKSSNYNNSNHQDNLDDTDENNLKTYDEQEDNLGLQPLVSGYLYKLNKGGVWQRRFFETDGKYLAYFKSHKRIKLLATLDLTKIGDISIDDEDQTGCTFKIQVKKRPYLLKAENSGYCEHWVINLHRVREARLQLGGMKIIAPSFQPAQEQLQPQDQPGVVITATRDRTHQCYDINSYMESMEETDVKKNKLDSPIGGGAMFAKWDKRQNQFQRMRSRLSRFVRWMRLARCNTAVVGRGVIRVRHSGSNSSAEQQQQYPFQYPHPSYEDGTNSTESQISSARPSQSGQDSAASSTINQNQGTSSDMSSAPSSSPRYDQGNDEKTGSVFA